MGLSSVEIPNFLYYFSDDLKHLTRLTMPHNKISGKQHVEMECDGIDQISPSDLKKKIMLHFETNRRGLSNGIPLFLQAGAWIREKKVFLIQCKFLGKNFFYLLGLFKVKISSKHL